VTKIKLSSTPEGVRDGRQEAVGSAKVDGHVARVRKVALAGVVALLQGLEVVAVAAAAAEKESLASAEIFWKGIFTTVAWGGRKLTHPTSGNIHIRHPQKPSV